MLQRARFAAFFWATLRQSALHMQCGAHGAAAPPSAITVAPTSEFSFFSLYDFSSFEASS